MKRRHFLLSIAGLLISQAGYAGEILHGSSAKASGQRERKVWQYATKLKGLRLAKPDETIQMVVFFDANCPSCKALWDWFDVMPSRNLASLWVPVAHMNNTSIMKAISLLRDSNAYQALKGNFKYFDLVRNKGGVAVVESPSTKERANIHNNNRFWAEMLFGSSPLILYRNRNGTYWQEIGFSEIRMSEILLQLAPSKLEGFK